MSAMFDRPEINKIFLIYGNLDDMFLTPDLQRSNFRPFLNSYLRSLGYERIVFYSGAKNMGKYVLDDRSAMLAINANKGRAADVPAIGTASPAPRRKRRIFNPNASASPPEQSIAENSSATPVEAARSEQPETTSLIYKQPKITPAEFLDEAKRMIADNSVRTAIVFPFFQDFVTDGSAPMQQYAELLSHLWDEYSLRENRNICVFLAPQMDEAALLGLFDRLAVGNVFRSRFFHADGTVNRGCTLHVGLPGRDEFSYLLEYLRLAGDGGKRLSYAQKELPRMVTSLMYYSREANRERNRSGYLNAVYAELTAEMKRHSETIVPWSESDVRRVYARYRATDSADPLEKLTQTKGWEAVARRVQDIVKDYRQKKARYLKEHPQKEEGLLYANERLVPPDDGEGFDYPVPHFVLKGNPGVGKTTVARLIGQIFYEAGILKRGMTIEATKDDLVDRYVGGTPGRTRAKLLEAEESVLFVDDAYSLIDRSEENNYSKEAIDELVAAMTNPRQYRFCLILAGYPAPMDELLSMNAGLASRFGQSNLLTINDYPPELLQSIFETQCRRDGYRFMGEKEGESDAPDLALFFRNLYQGRDRANFGNARDAVAIARDVKMRCSLRDDAERCIIKEDFAGYTQYFEKHGADSIEEIYAELDRYVGLDFVKELFDNVRLELLDAEDCRRRGIMPESYPDHYIFAGNPGTGKTTVGKLLGKFYHAMGVLGGAETLFTDASELIGSHVGDSKNNTVRKIQEAIDHNALLYIDEAYQIADTAYSSEIVGAMMTRMTENAADFKMVFGMYSNRVEDFLALNAGLARRVRVVTFPDYTPEQLLAVFDRTIAAQGRTITEDARHLVSLLLTYRYETRGADFGNAGEVKRLASDMKKRQLRRTSDKNLPEDERYCYTPDDIPPESLALIRDRVNPRGLEDIMRELDEQIGLSGLKEILLRKHEELLYAQRCGQPVGDICPGYYFFVGNPGTGKSTGAKLFAACLREMGIVKTDRFFACTAKDLIGQYVGETDKKTYALLEKSVGGVLFIDEAYSLAYADSPHSGADFRKEALEQIIAFMDVPEHRQNCCIIFAGYEKDMQGLYRSNSGMRSRIEEVVFQDFSAEEMYEIFALFCRRSGYTVGKGVKEALLPVFEKMRHMPYFANGRSARTVYEESLSGLRRRVLCGSAEGTDFRTLLPEDLPSEAECLAIVSGG